MVSRSRERSGRFAKMPMRARQHAERIGIGEPDLRFIAFNKGRIGYAPMGKDWFALPNRMRQQSGSFAHRENEIEAWRVVADELIPILWAWVGRYRNATASAVRLHAGRPRYEH